MMPGRLSIALMMLAALLLSEAATARNGGHQGDRSADVSGSGHAHERATGKGHAKAEHFGASRRHEIENHGL